MKKSGVIGLVSLLFIVILGLFVFGGYGESVFNYPANETLVGNNYPYAVTNGTNFSSQTDPSFSNASYDHELVINGTRYGISNCLKDVECINSPNATIPNGVNLTAYINVTNGSAGYVNQTFIIYLSYETVVPYHNHSGNYRANASYFSAGSILSEFYINDTMLANYTLYLYNASNGALLHSYNRTITSDVNKTYNYTVLSWAETLNFSTTFYSGNAMDEDRYVYSLRSVDWFNNKNASNVTIILDRTIPTIVYYGWAESNNTVTNGSLHDIEFNVTFSDTYFANATYTLLNTSSRLVLHSSNVTSSASTNVNFSGLPDGNYTFYVNVTDLAANQNTTVRWKTVYLNATPIISFGAATFVNNTNFTTNNIYLNISLVENNLMNITFRLINSSSGAVLNTTIYNATNYGSYQMAVNYTSLSDGNYSVNVTATDSFNHRGNVVNRFFTIDTTSPIASVSRSAATILQTQTETLTCTGTDNIDPNTFFDLQIKTPGGNYVTLESRYFGGTGISYSYTTTEIYGTYYVRCVVSDSTGHSHTVDTSFFVDWATSESSSSSSGGSSGSSRAPSLAPEEEEEEEVVIAEEEEEIIAESLETNVDWTEIGVTELTGIVGGEVYTFVTAADEESHTINVNSVDETTGTVVVTIQSEPQTITLTLESPIAEVDLNGDLTNDMRITLVGITDGEATISVEKIDGLFEEPANGLSAWAWVGIIVLVLGISAAIVYFVVKPQEKVVKRK